MIQVRSISTDFSQHAQIMHLRIPCFLFPVQLVELEDGNPQLQSLNPTCTVKADLDSMVRLYQGKLKPSLALLREKITVKGNRRCMALIGSAMKETIEETSKLGFTTGDVTVVVERQSEDSKRFKGTLKANITSTVEEKDGNEKPVTKYIISVVNELSGQSWEVIYFCYSVYVCMHVCVMCVCIDVCVFL